MKPNLQKIFSFNGLSNFYEASLALEHSIKTLVLTGTVLLFSSFCIYPLAGYQGVVFSFLAISGIAFSRLYLSDNLANRIEIKKTSCKTTNQNPFCNSLPKNYKLKIQDAEIV